MKHDRRTIRDCIEAGEFDLEWTRGLPEVQFWAGEPHDDIVRNVPLRDLLLRELQVCVPRDFFGAPMEFDPPKHWHHAQKVRLLQALIAAYDTWAKKANIAQERGT